MSQRQKVLLVDGANIAYRNHYAQNLQTTTGVSTGMIYGVINSMLSMTRDITPDIVNVVWDPKGGSTYRKNLYKLYKANREAMDPAFYEELDTLRQLLKALGVTQIIKDGVECDDILGFLATEYYADYDVYIASNDKDILQVMSETVRIVHPDHGIIQTDDQGRVAIKEQNKVIYLKPYQVADFKALVGDKSDNYPGLMGFGIGAAITYFANHDTIDPILNSTADLRGMRSQALNAIMTGRGILPLFKLLATLNMEEGRVEIPERPMRRTDIVETLFDHLELNQFKALGQAMYRIGG